MRQVVEDRSVTFTRVMLMCQALDWKIREHQTRIVSRELIVEANKLFIQAQRMRVAAHEKRRDAKVESASPGIDVLLNEERVLTEQAEQLHQQAVQQIVQAMRLRAGLVHE